MTRRQIPNRWAQLTADERMAQAYLDRGDLPRLMESARVTSNLSLYGIALDLLIQVSGRKPRRRG